MPCGCPPPRTGAAPSPILVGHSPLAFQVRLIADAARPGRLYLTWLQAGAVATLGFPQAGNPIQFARSDDGGATWQGPVTVSDPSRAGGGSVSGRRSSG